ncbi:gluconokinase [Polymorphobacter sp. PAMC 29334]|uniref:gluconokinase n=1 Tax=Polymorphobacter sp. PAMC 29334 TaxID=2862331 RepID=UPI001C676727|nr:gluconokinase [Polymorphobacter sp. PAMC 29334]QYE36816.1 gluconokinase [Polymorphobacter sp. PAMC 29334]
MAIVVMGVSGSGKSTLGAMLAARLGCRFVEGDTFHDAAAIAMMRSGQPLGDRERWPWLDRVGAALAREVSAIGVVVVACSALKRVYRDRLAGCVTVPTRFVLLDADADTLRERLTERAGHYMPPSLLASQLATLERPGADEAALTLDTGTPPDLLARTALDWLERPLAMPPNGTRR